MSKRTKAEWKANQERVRNQPMVRQSYADGKHWFVVRTNIKCENRAEMGLAAKGYRTFCPKLKKWVSHARVRSVVQRPLIARHFFVEIDANRKGFGDVRSTDGVESLLGICGTPIIVPRRFVEEFIARQLKGEWDYASKDAEGNPIPLTNGCKVMVCGGEYDNLFGVIRERKVRNGMMLVWVIERALLTKLSPLEVRAA